MAALAMGIALVYLPDGYGFNATILFQIKKDVVLNLSFPTLFFPFFKSLCPAPGLLLHRRSWWWCWWAPRTPST